MLIHATKTESELLEKEQIVRELAEQAELDAIDANTGKNLDDDVMLDSINGYVAETE
ncbi:hypothetical protein ACTXGW_03575 [Psychrobacter faecalis]|uniref:hypothetical protein n=1 Tax=Psychrobacter faecalis TaxID=180588 RepID=UPI003FD21554